MWSIQDVSAEELAKLFHHYRGALAHDFECHSPSGASERAATSVAASSSTSSSSSWDRTPQKERRLMIAAARLALLELACAPEHAVENRQYFAKPGEADWGC